MGNSQEKIDLSSRLPTILERILINPDARGKFEVFVEGSVGELLLLIFRPLLYFELAAIKNRKSAETMGEIFKKMYILPHTKKLYAGETVAIFKNFAETRKVTAGSFRTLKDELDNYISRKYIIEFKKENPDLKLGDENLALHEIDFENHPTAVMSKTLTRKN